MRQGSISSISSIRGQAEYPGTDHGCFLSIVHGTDIELIAVREWFIATNLVVRNVDESNALALKQLAASHGRSAEAEHREILRTVLQQPKRRSVAEVLASMPNVGEDADFNARNA